MVVGRFRHHTDAVTSTPRMSAPLWWCAALALVGAACSTTAESSEPLPTTDASAVTQPAVASTAPATAPSIPGTIAPTTAPPPTTTIATTTTSSTSTTSTTTTTTTVPGPTTTIPPELNPCPPNGSGLFRVRPPVAFDAPPIGAEWSPQTIGVSAQGRDIVALVRPAVEEARHRIMIVGSLHGNEITAFPIVRSMVTATVPQDVELWLIPDANPDGTLVGTRCNANGVDLNRNFDWEWDPADGGPAPMSEPETQVLAEMIFREQPDLVVWVHHALGYVAPIGPTEPEPARAWAGASGVPFRDDISQHGGSESWTAFVANVPSILLEVESRDLSPELIVNHQLGLDAMLASLP